MNELIAELSPAAPTPAEPESRSEKMLRAWWNPLDERVWLPRTVGVGWNLNVAALAVRLHLIRPDDEDEPFSHLAGWALGAAIFVLGVLTVAIPLSWWLIFDRLPDPMPTHWNAGGQVDGWTPRIQAWIFPTLLAAIPLALGLLPTALRGARWAQVGALSLASIFVVQGFGAWLMMASSNPPPLLAIIGLVAIPLLAPIVIATSLALVSRHGEIRENLA